MDPDQLALFPEDVCERKHGGNAYSEAAFRQTKRARDAARIYAWIDGRGRKGAIANEAEAALGLCHSTASARFSDLKASGYLVALNESRKTLHGASAGVFVSIAVARRLRGKRPDQLRLALEGDGHG